MNEFLNSGNFCVIINFKIIVFELKFSFNLPKYSCFGIVSGAICKKIVTIKSKFKLVSYFLNHSFTSSYNVSPGIPEDAHVELQVSFIRLGVPQLLSQ